MVGKVVTKSQNAFIKGKQILDVVLIVNEAIDSMLMRKSFEVICKFNIEIL